MTKLYRFDTNSLDWGPLLLTGDPITVDGTPMVRLGHGTIVVAENFHASIADAKRAAADAMQEKADQLQQQIVRMRREAADADAC